MDTFEHEGIWWDPRAPEDQWVGTLRYDQTRGATLALTIPRPPRRKAFAVVETYDLILGLTTNNKPITLVNCFEQRSSFTFGPGSREIFANSIIVGAHAEDPDPLVTSASVTFDHLSEWWGRPGIDSDYGAEKGDFSMRYAPPAPLVVHDDGAWRVSLRSDLVGSSGRHQIAMREEASFHIQPATPQRLSEFRRHVQTCSDFLTVACLTLCKTTEFAITLPADPGERGQRGTVHAIPVYQKRKGRSSVLVHMLLRFEDVATRPQETVGAWFSAAEMLNDVRALYLLGVYGDGFVEMRLLALTQAVEAFHRRRYAGTYMDAATFVTQVFEPMKAAIPTSISESHRAALVSRLRFANEFSQSKRMDALFTEHAETLRMLVAEPSTWVRPILDHRNAFTHFDPATQPSAESDRVVLYNFVLQLLVEACFLTVMGFTTEEIASMARRSETYRQLAARFFRHERA